MMQAIYAEEKGYWVVHIIYEGHRFGMGSILFRVSKDGMLEGEKYLTHACMLLRRSKGDLPVTGGPRQTQGRVSSLLIARYEAWM